MQQQSPVAAPNTFVLIHGAWHGAWCWYKVVPLLRERGHKVVCPDLPGHGPDRTPLSQITLQAYVDRVWGVLEAESRPAILVGHSMGGAVITQAAEQRPHRVASLVYLAAFLLQDGQSVLTVAKADKEALLLPNVVLSGHKDIAIVRTGAQKSVFYADCREEDIELARMLLAPQACAPLASPVRTTRRNYERVPRTYIECVLDSAISVSMQRAMYSNLPCARVFSMNTSHSPFFSSPDELANHLSTLAE